MKRAGVAVGSDAPIGGSLSMSGRVLVENYCLSNRGGGIKTYTEALMRHWPKESGIRLVNFRGPRKERNSPAAATSSLDQMRSLRDLFGGATSPRDAGRRWGILFPAYRAAFALEARFGKYEAVFQPNNLCPITGPPMIATLHDLSVVEHPEWHTEGRVARWKRYLPAAIRRTRQWIAVSEFTRERMVSVLKIDAGRIVVIPEAARPLPKPGPCPAAMPGKYFLFVGTIEPRKNIGLLLDAYGRLPVETRRAHRLVLVGPAGWGKADFWRSVLQHPMAAEAMVTGYLSDADLSTLFAHAAALFLPSFYEGFGLQLLEAMAAGCPVVCSEIAAFREVAGGAAEMLSPDDAAAWSERMARSISDCAWRTSLVAAGITRARQFSWEETTRRHAELFAEVVSAHN